MRSDTPALGRLRGVMQCKNPSTVSTTTRLLGRFLGPVAPRVVAPLVTGLLVVGLLVVGLLAPNVGLAQAPAVSPKPRTDDVVVASPTAAKLKAILTSAPGTYVAFGTVLDLDTGVVVFDLSGAQGLTPASVSKLFATAAAAHALSFAETLVTRVHATPVKSGRVKRLIIVGAGDPSLNKTDLGRLADGVANAGVKRASHLIVDSSLFDNLLPRGFAEKHTDASYRAPIDALNVDQGTIVISVERGAAVGARPTVVITPPSAAIEIDNTAKMVKGKARGLTVATKDGPNKKTIVVVRGVMGLQRKRIVAGRRRVNNAAFHAGHAFARMLRDRGVDVGKVSFGSLPAATPKAPLRVVASHTSKSVFDLMSFCNKFSHNGYAETFFKLAGQRIKGAPGTCAKGEAAVQQTLSGAGIDWKTVRLGNGSGLYHVNRVTTSAVVALLQAMAKAGKQGDLWRRTLAIGGVDGTLRRRLKTPATRGKIFAKTGTLDDVTALAGYAISKGAGGEGHRYAFALFYNQVKRPAYLYRRVHDKFLTYLLDPTGKLTPPPPKGNVKPKKPPKRHPARVGATGRGKASTRKAKTGKATPHRRPKARRKR